MSEKDSINEQEPVDSEYVEPEPEPVEQQITSLDDLTPEQKAQVEFSVHKAISLCEFAIQKYICEVTDKPPVYWGFSDDDEIRYIEFKNRVDPTASIKIGLDVVDKDWMFPPEKCRAQVIRQEMGFMIRGLNVVLALMINNPELSLSSKRPDLFNEKSKFVTDPNNSTCVLYGGESQDEYKLNTHPKRIGFVLGDPDPVIELVEEDPEEEDNTTLDELVQKELVDGGESVVEKTEEIVD